ncbi:Glycosyltransferase family 39 protein [Nitrospira tepida]|uniref:Glycosyltransferase family 39 protein n=1 Tax=Nitrospira tepida TaxID=2973512 RepID=A0AA86T6H0_9BACT|nr:Glycosyltransferase family 39 protein [Nitrospira tepida]
MHNTEKGTIAWLFLVAVIVRLAALWIVPAPPIDDSAQAAYLAGAHKLLHGEGFRDPSYPIYAPPLYGMFIAFLQSIFGEDLGPVKIVQVMVDSVTVILVFLIMREIFNARTGLLAAAVLAVYPFAIYLAISIAAEPLVTCLLAGFVLLVIYAVRLQDLRYFAAAGIVLGLATLTRGATQFLPFLLVFVLVFLIRGGKQVLISYMVCLAGFVLVISPWTVRNLVVLDDVIPVATAGGIVILMGSNETYLTIPGKTEMNEKYPPPQGIKPSEVDRYWRNAGITEHLRHLQADPIGFVTFNIAKFFRLWYATESGDNHQWTLGGNLPLYLLACVGLVIALRTQQYLVLIPLFVIGYYALLHWASLPLFRYMMPVMPYVIGLASFGALGWANQIGFVQRFPETLLSATSKQPSLDSHPER